MALLAVTISQIAEMGWWYIPMVLQASLIMLGWALVINNVGGRRYPSKSLLLACSLRYLDRLVEVYPQLNGSGRVDGSSFNHRAFRRNAIGFASIVHDWRDRLLSAHNSGNTQK